MLILSISYIVKKFTFAPPNPPKYKVLKNESNNKDEIYFLLETDELQLAYRRINPDKFDVKYTKIPDTQNNKQIPILIIKPKFEINACIIYCQGNNGDLGTSLFECNEISYNCCATIVTFEYPGYGECKDEEIEEKEFFNRIKIIYMYVIDKLKYNPNRIFLYGFSLGTGIVFDFACKKEYPVAGMILQSPFLSIFRIIYNGKNTKYFDLFNNCDKAKNICTDILFLHGNKDKTIPYTHGRILSELIPEKYFYNFLTVDGADHNNLIKMCKEDMFDYIKIFMSDCIIKYRKNVKFNNYITKNYFNTRKKFYLESEDHNLKEEKESNDIDIFNHENNKASTFSNFKINNINNDISKEEHKNDTNYNSNIKHFHHIDSTNLQILSKNKDLNPELSTINNNKIKGKNTLQKNNNKYYHVIIGTNQSKINRDKFWTIYKKNRDTNINELNKISYFNEKGNSSTNITSSNISINNNKN